MKALKYYMVFIFLMIPFLLNAQTPKEGYVAPPEFSRVGMSGWQFLKIPTDARTASLGAISTVLSHGDASSSLANPASISDVENMGVSFSHMNYLVETKYTTGSFVKNLGSLGSFGINIVYLDYGDIYRTANEQVLSGDGVPTGKIRTELDAGVFSGNDFSLGLCYARNVTDKLQIGTNIRYISETLDDVGGISASGWTIDIGTVYYTGINSLRIAMSGRNFGPDTEFAEWKERIGIPPVNVRTPMIFALGLAYDFFSSEDDPHFLTMAGEFNHPNDGPEKYHVAAEYSWMNLFVLRAGYRFNYDEVGMTVGGGLNLATHNYDIKLDYAYLPFGRFNDLHMFTIVLGYD